MSDVVRGGELEFGAAEEGGRMKLVDLELGL